MIKSAAKKTLLGIGLKMRSSSSNISGEIYKIPITSPGGAGRVIFLLVKEKEVIALIMAKPKHDKLIGMNMSLKNPNFNKILHRNLETALEDIKKSAYKEYKL